jgi:hypothetical protein
MPAASTCCSPRLGSARAGAALNPSTRFLFSLPLMMLALVPVALVAAATVRAIISIRQPTSTTSTSSSSSIISIRQIAPSSSSSSSATAVVIIPSPVRVPVARALPPVPSLPSSAYSLPQLSQRATLEADRNEALSVL